MWDWLDRHAPWQVALITIGCLLPLILLGSFGLNWLMHRPIAPDWLLIFAPAFSVLYAVTSTYARYGRLRR